MDDSMAQAFPAASVETTGWKGIVALVCAVLLAILFAMAGISKITDPMNWAVRMTQFQVPAVLAIPATLGLGISELVAAVFLVVPRFRRWGGWLTAFLLVVFMAYMAIFYKTLQGMDCSCFPMLEFLKRSVGPMFFVGDGVMLLMAFAAALWSRASHGLRPAAIITAAICVFAGVSLGVAQYSQSGVAAPPTVLVDGQPHPINSGRVFLYFFDPECLHCLDAGKKMSKMTWKQTRIVVVPTRMPQFAAGFLDDSGLAALEPKVTSDLTLLKEKFPFQDPPFGVLLENGRQKETFVFFDETQPEKRLRELGYIE